MLMVVFIVTVRMVLTAGGLWEDVSACKEV